MKYFLIIIAVLFFSSCSKYPDYDSAGTPRASAAGNTYGLKWWVNTGNTIFSSSDPQSYQFYSDAGSLPPDACASVLGNITCCVKAYPKWDNTEVPDLTTVKDRRYKQP